LDLGFFAVNKLPEDDSLMSKHVRVGTQYEVCFLICFIEFYLVNTNGQFGFNVQRFIQLDIRWVFV